MITMSIRALLLPVTLGVQLGGHSNSSGMSMEVGNATASSSSNLIDYDDDYLVDYSGDKLEDY